MISQVTGEAGVKAEIEPMGSVGNKYKGGSMGGIKSWAQAVQFGENSLVLMQVNCRSIYNKALDLW